MNAKDSNSKSKTSKKRQIPKQLYTLRRLEDQMHTIAKIDTSTMDLIEAPYHIQKRDNGELICTCPSRFVPCKHVKLLQHATKAYPEEYQTRYWEVQPHAKWIDSYTYAEVVND